MNLRRDPSKALAVGFVALLVVSIATVGWWIADTVDYANEIEQGFLTLYGREADAWPQAAVELEQEGARRVNRILWEGGFFLAVLIGGLLVMTRTIRHDAELRRRQQNFLAAVSHEFKSPLASIRLAAETLVLRASEPDGKRLGARILEDGDRLLRMVDNLLDTTRLEEGRQRLKPAITSIRAAAEVATAEVAERARLCDIAISLDVPPDLSVAVDPGALETTLRNLLDNAIKACVAGQGHAIAVRAQRGAEGIELEVRDDGLGFPPEDAAMIFEKFYRIGDEQQRRMPGTGLGLYIVKRLVELSGARIEAQSDGTGRGATVTIRWPERQAT